MAETQRIDYEDTKRNMYGCMDCPKCGSRYRYATQDLVIHCDDCHYTEQGFETREEHKDA